MADDTKTTPEVTEEKPATPAVVVPTEKKEETPAKEPETKAEEKEDKAEVPATLETTTANDGNISINQESPAVPAAEKPAENLPPTTTDLPVEPVVVKAEDVQTTAPGNDQLQEQIESLTGEIQALEAKIERLTGGSAPTPSEPVAEAPVVESQPMADSQIEKSAELVKPVEKTPEKTESAAFNPTPIPSTPTPSASPVTDIYSSIGKPRPAMDSAAQDETAHPSAIAVISEVLVILGTILFVILAATPLFREMVGEDLYQVIRSVGWLTTAATLLLGTLMAVFGKAKSAITLIGFVFLLLSAFMYIGMNYSSLLGPLESSLSTVFDFYR